MKKLFAVLSVLCFVVAFSATAMAQDLDLGIGNDDAYFNSGVLNQGAGDITYIPVDISDVGVAVSEATLTQVSVGLVGANSQGAGLGLLGFGAGYSGGSAVGNFNDLILGICGNVGLNGIGVSVGNFNNQGQVNAIAIGVGDAGY